MLRARNVQEASVTVGDGWHDRDSEFRISGCHTLIQHVTEHSWQERLHLRRGTATSASYNAQVRAFAAALPTGARVGSVDKFQGQEAPVCILSLCSSYGEYGSRGLILDRNRINVAVSRAQCLAVVVADPRIACTPAGSINEMMLINLFCKMADSGQNTEP